MVSQGNDFCQAHMITLVDHRTPPPSHALVLFLRLRRLRSKCATSDAAMASGEYIWEHSRVQYTHSGKYIGVYQLQLARSICDIKL